LIQAYQFIIRPQLFGGKDVIEYLFTNYGPGVENIPPNLRLASNSGSSSFGGGKGSKVRPNIRSDFTKLKPITLFGWEGAPFVKPVRDTLNELGLAHVFVNCANGSQNRDQLSRRSKGVFQVPYIIDPNTNIEMFESAEIIKYLEEVYTVKN
jgi:glutaredoxin